MSTVKKHQGYSNFDSDSNENLSRNNFSQNQQSLQSTLNMDQNSADPNNATENQNTSFVSNYLNKVKPTNSQKTFLTFIYCLTFWNFGICMAIFGPTLLDLACQTSSSLSAMSLLYFMQNFTSLIGCFLSGMVLKNNW